MVSTVPNHVATINANFFDHEFLVDPYPTYALLREHEPVHWNDRLNGWVLTRHSDVYDAHLEPETFSSERLGAMLLDRITPDSSIQVQKFMRIAPEWMLFRDPPDHTRVRKLMNQEFRTRDIKRLGPQMADVVSELIDDMLEKREFDLVTDFAYQVPGRVLAAQYGLPKRDAVLLTDWWYQIRNMQRIFLGAEPQNVAPAGSPVGIAFDDMRAYLDDLVRDRRKSPKDDLVSRVALYPEGFGRDGQRLSEDEMFAHLMLLPLASFGTTMDLITNGLLGLLTQRDQWELIKAGPGLIPSAVEEVLRFDASVQLTHRLANRDVEVAGVHIREGELVFLVRGAANRDPSRWTDPDRIDVTRADSAHGHVGFGVGIHHCLGAGLARAEVAAAYAALAERVPDLRLCPGRPHVWKADTPQFRGLNR